MLSVRIELDGLLLAFSKISIGGQKKLRKDLIGGD
jgi:hypothetical protein